MIAIVFGVLLFAVMTVGAARLLHARSFGAAVVVSVAAASWLVVNNNNFEGPILLRLNDKHGLTAADLVAYGFECLTLAIMLLTPRTAAGAGRTGPADVAIGRRWLQTAVCAATFIAGLVASYYYQP